MFFFLFFFFLGLLPVVSRAGCCCSLYCKTAPLSHESSISPRNEHQSRARAPCPTQMLQITNHFFKGGALVRERSKKQIMPDALNRCLGSRDWKPRRRIGIWAGCVWLAVAGCGCCLYCKTAPFSHGSLISPKNKHHSRPIAPHSAQML